MRTIHRWKPVLATGVLLFILALSLPYMLDVISESVLLSEEKTDPAASPELLADSGLQPANRETTTEGTVSGSPVTSATLTAEASPAADGGIQIMLDYTIFDLLDVGSLEAVVFTLPPEMAVVTEEAALTAAYDIPDPLLPGVELVSLQRKQGTFSSEEITFSGNKVKIVFQEPVSVVSVSTYYNFSLSFQVAAYPPTSEAEYAFSALALEQVSDVGSSPSLASIPVPVPEPPVLEKPVYSTATVLQGTGEAGMTAVLSIGGVEAGTVPVNPEGNFSFPIEPQEAGTILSVVIVNSATKRSTETSATVLHPPDTEAPAAPVLNTVYSNDSFVTGTGEAHTKVTLTIGTSTYTGEVDNSGTFSIATSPREAGTEITAVLTDDAGNVSAPGTTTVQAAVLAFRTVPEALSFQETVIRSTAITVQRQNPDWMIEVLDTRGTEGTWSVMAQASGPLALSSDPSITLPDTALFYADNLGNRYPLAGQTVEVYRGTTGTAQVIPVSWAPKSGPLIQVAPGDAQTGTYTTTITWTLVNVPQ